MMKRRMVAVLPLTLVTVVGAWPDSAHGDGQVPEVHEFNSSVTLAAGQITGKKWRSPDIGGYATLKDADTYVVNVSFGKKALKANDTWTARDEQVYIQIFGGATGPPTHIRTTTRSNSLMCPAHSQRTQ